MSKATDLAARAARLASRPVPDAVQEAAERSTPSPRSKPVRLSVDVSPVTYRKVKAFPDDMNLPEVTGKASIPTVEVFRALVEELEVNEELRKQVAKRIRVNVSK